MDRKNGRKSAEKKLLACVEQLEDSAPCPGKRRTAVNVFNCHCHILFICWRSIKSCDFHKMQREHHCTWYGCHLLCLCTYRKKSFIVLPNYPVSKSIKPILFCINRCVLILLKSHCKYNASESHI